MTSRQELCGEGKTVYLSNFQTSIEFSCTKVTKSGVEDRIMLGDA